MNSNFSDYTNLYANTKQDGSLNTPPIYLDFRFGNLCNFTCRMCGSYASSSWAKEEKYYGKSRKLLTIMITGLTILDFGKI